MAINPRSRLSDHSYPLFDVARYWRHPVVLASLVAALILLGSLLNRPEPLPVNSVLIVDVSESALNNGNFLADLCRLYRLELRHGDRHHEIWFADTGRFIGSYDFNTFSTGPICNLPPDQQELVEQELGKARGTSLTAGIQVAIWEVKRLRESYPNMPLVVVIFGHKFEPGAQESEPLNNIEQAIQALSEQVHAIRVIGPTGEIANALSASLSGLSNAKLCPFVTARTHRNACLQNLFEGARARSNQAWS